MLSDRVVVIGGANIDIRGQSSGPLIFQDSNPGMVRYALGGVGRNIAHNLALLNVSVLFLTALGDDANAARIADSCRELGIDLGQALTVKGEFTSTYVFLGGPDGDMALAVSDMSVCDRITPEYLEKHLQEINSARLVILDTNIPKDSVHWLAEHCRAPLFADPVSIRKAEKLASCLDRIHTLKPNRLEAEYLSGVRIRTSGDVEKAAKALLDQGLQRVFISLGGDGVLFADQQTTGTLPAFPADAKNMTGAGDAFMSGLAWAFLQEADLSESALYASAASVIAIEGEETINPRMSVPLLREKVKAFKQIL